MPFSTCRGRIWDPASPRGPTNESVVHPPARARLRCKASNKSAKIISTGLKHLVVWLFSPDGRGPSSSRPLGTTPAQPAPRAGPPDFFAPVSRRVDGKNRQWTSGRGKTWKEHSWVTLVFKKKSGYQAASSELAPRQGPPANAH